MSTAYKFFKAMMWAPCNLALLLVMSLHAADSGYRSSADKAYASGMQLAREASETRESQAAQQAVDALRRALFLYQQHLEANPQDENALRDRLTEINSTVFWTAKFTTLDLFHVDTPPAKGDTTSSKTPTPPPGATTPKKAEQDSLKEADALVAADMAIRRLLKERRVLDAQEKCRAFKRDYPDSRYLPLMELMEEKTRLVGEMLGYTFDAARTITGKTMNFSMLDGNVFEDASIRKVDMDMLFLANKDASFPTRLSLLSPETIILLVSHLNTAESYICIAAYRSVLGDEQKAYDDLVTAKMLGSSKAQEYIEMFRRESQLRKELGGLSRRVKTRKKQDAYFEKFARYFEKGDYQHAMDYLVRLDKQMQGHDDRTIYDARCRKELRITLFRAIRTARTICDFCHNKHKVKCRNCNGKGYVMVSGGPFRKEKLKQRCRVCGGKKQQFCPKSYKLNTSPELKAMEERYKNLSM